jgi:hydroxymethylbilane synthase
LRPDLTVLPLQGNVDTRLRKLAEGQYDAIVIAAAGISRLGREKEITEFLNPADILPAPAQGVLVVALRQEDKQLQGLLRPLHDVSTWICARAERSFLRILQGGCRVPVGAFASHTGDDLFLRGVIAHTDGKRVLRFNQSGPAFDPESVGRELAQVFLNNGANEILKDFGREGGENHD